MSLWDKISGNDQDEHNKNRPPVVTESTTQSVKKEEGGFFSKIKDVLDGDDDKQPALPPKASPTYHEGAPSQQKSDDWKDKFKDLLDGGASNRREAEEERLRLEAERIAKEEEARRAAEKASFTGKIKGLFKSDAEEEEERQRLAAEAERKRKEAEEAKRKENSWTERIKDVFDNDDKEREAERLRLAEEAKQNQSFGAKIGSLFKEKEKPPPPKQTVSDKIFKVLEGKDKEPAKDRGWLGDKLNSAAGGGHKSEANEDKLDKMIDLYQKHVLKEGDQSNESALEQAKDEQISDAIRKGIKGVTGREVFSDKKH